MRNNPLLWPLLPMCAVILAACSSVPSAYDKPKDTIKGDLSDASNEALNVQADGQDASRALYPSMRLDMPPVVAETLEPRFDLVVNRASARDVLLSMVADTRYSMLLPNDLSGEITVNLKAVTVPEALSALRQLYGYEYRIEGSRIFIQSQNMQTRIMKVNYLNAVRKGGSDIRVISGSVSDNTSSNSNSNSGSSNSSSNSSSGSSSSGNTSFVMSKISTTEQSDFWSELSAAITAILGGREGRSVVISPQSGVMVVRGLPSELSQIEAFLHASQVSLERQVVIEAKIIEVTLSNNFQAGINWGLFNSKLSVGQLNIGAGASKSSGITTTTGVTSTPISGTAGQTLANASNAVNSMFGLVFKTGNFSTMLNLLEEQGKVHVLSSPRVATLNNQKAVLKVGTDDFFVTEISTNATSNSSGTGQTVTPKITFQPFFSGIALDVTPQIDDDNLITLHIHPMVSKVTTVSQTINLGSTIGTFVIPLASSAVSEMDSVVRAQDGQMIALGGLIKQSTNNTDDQVPGIGALPIVGNLFKQKSHEVERRELVILLKPTVIQSSVDWADDISNSERRVKRLLDTDNINYFSDPDRKSNKKAQQ
ncbi:pilus (MSHA type) biogenesis protein MshL [Uliginosibacterium gangwonense]|uniref:pilus (MSHA type) biogenesis protein MshL n=1 Tax=Uliginosibacterium gangwonense TaxID=392736 RepID=UPI00035D9395|nr:pilus (MSHA type) biogenesis protein MshL [Uliginosibacterium gangwonense]